MGDKSLYSFSHAEKLEFIVVETILCQILSRLLSKTVVIAPTWTDSRRSLQHSARKGRDHGLEE
jgi:hypothetical protein